MSRSLRRWRVAAIQMTSTEDREKNLAAAERLVRRAAGEGAALVALPENFYYLRLGPKNKVSESLDGELVERLRALASGAGVYLLAGSIPEKVEGARASTTPPFWSRPRGGCWPSTGRCTSSTCT